MRKARYTVRAAPWKGLLAPVEVWVGDRWAHEVTVWRDSTEELEAALAEHAERKGLELLPADEAPF